jgi:hypothetical protein
MKWFWDNYSSNQTNPKEPTVLHSKHQLSSLRAAVIIVIAFCVEFYLFIDNGNMSVERLAK